jgi:hypothetical protein
MNVTVQVPMDSDRKGSIFLIGRGPHPLVSSKQLLKMDHTPSATSQKNFWNIVLQGEFEAG